jgi:hypothetical protein
MLLPAIRLLRAISEGIKRIALDPELGNGQIGWSF